MGASVMIALVIHATAVLVTHANVHQRLRRKQKRLLK